MKIQTLGLAEHRLQHIVSTNRVATTCQIVEGDLQRSTALHRSTPYYAACFDWETIAGKEGGKFRLSNLKRLFIIYRIFACVSKVFIYNRVVIMQQ